MHVNQPRNYTQVLVRVNAAGAFETSVTAYETRRRYNSVYHSLNSHTRGNLKPYLRKSSQYVFSIVDFRTWYLQCVIHGHVWMYGNSDD
jgi:hypothetical protein